MRLTCFHCRSIYLLWLLCFIPLGFGIWQANKGWQKHQAERALQTQALDIRTFSPSSRPQNLQIEQAKPLSKPIFLANSRHQNQNGYRVYQIWRVSPTQSALMELGWSANTRLSLPKGDGHVTAGVAVWRPYHARFTLSGARIGTHGTVDAIDWQGLKQQYPDLISGILTWPHPMPPLQIIQGNEAYLNADKHFAYALQWGLMFLCFVGLLIYRHRTRKTGHEQ